jgi:multiple sugar transport system permease protein
MTAISPPPPPARALPACGAQQTRRLVARVAVGALLALYGLVSVYPFLWMISAAFKNQIEVMQPGWTARVSSTSSPGYICPWPDPH